MNIYKHEFKMNFRSAITWSVALIAIISLFMAFFSSFAEQAEMLNSAMENFPPELLMAFGMDGLDMSTVLGFFSLGFLFCQICVSIQAANYGFSLISIEESELTADFLLAKPVGRTKILTSKLLAALTNLAITNIVIWVSSFVMINIFREGRLYETRTLVLLLLTITFLQLFFLTVGVVISLMLRRVRSVTPFSMALAFGMYVLSAFGGMLGEEKLELITPFKHFEPNYIVSNAAFDTPLVLISVVVILLSIAGSYLLYSRRNIPSAV